MTKRNYWLDLFTGATWKEFKAAGAKVSGFRESRWNTVQKIKPGDYFLCYLHGLPQTQVGTAPQLRQYCICNRASLGGPPKLSPIRVLSPLSYCGG